MYSLPCLVCPVYSALSSLPCLVCPVYSALSSLPCLVCYLQSVLGSGLVSSLLCIVHFWSVLLGFFLCVIVHFMNFDKVAEIVDFIYCVLDLFTPLNNVRCCSDMQSVAELPGWSIN